MNPGRFMDQIVAERVLGLRVEETADHNGIDHLWLKDRLDLSGAVPLPRYSTDIEDSWEVLERLIWDSFSVRLSFDKISNWSLWLDDQCIVSFLTTAPHAICLGALKLKEEQIK